MANVGKIELELSKRASTATPSDLHSYAKAIEKLQLGEVCGVFDTIGDLPDPATANPACLYLVLSEEVLFVVRDGAWQAVNPPPPPVTEFWAWGYDWFNTRPFGNVTYTNEVCGDQYPLYSPVLAACGINDWAQVDIPNAWITGRSGAHGIRKNGTLWGWGANAYGQIGDGTTQPRSSPIQIGTDANWCRVKRHQWATIAIKTDTTMWVWGSNSLSANTQAVSTCSPVQVPGTGWVDAFPGQAATFAIKNDGTMWAWGNQQAGVLITPSGQTNGYNRTPETVIGGGTWITAASGIAHGIGIKSDGTMWGWGENGCGNVGDNTTISRSSPVQVVGSFTDWCAASAGENTSAGIRTNGTIWAWGRNFYGRIGDGTNTPRSSPVQVAGGFTNWCHVNVSYGGPTTAIKTDGTVWYWGDDWTSNNQFSPVQLPGATNAVWSGSDRLMGAILRCY